MASKSYRKFMATGLTAAVVASAVAPVASAATFTDVPAGAWYKGAVEYVSGKGYMTGTSATTFAPLKDMTRAEAATLFANKLNLYKDGQTAGFNDVKSGAWYHNAVAAVKEGKIMGSTGDNMFSPDRPITRGEVAALIVRAYDFKGTGKETSFTDVNNSIFKNDIATLVEMKIADGKTATKFAPNDLVSRSEMAAFIQKADEAVKPAEDAKISSVAAVGVNKVAVTFNTDVNEYNLKATNFKVSNLSVNEVSVKGNVATLTLSSELSNGTTYTVTATGLKNAEGKEIKDSTANFLYSVDVVKGISLTKKSFVRYANQANPNLFDYVEVRDQNGKLIPDSQIAAKNVETDVATVVSTAAATKGQLLASGTANVNIKYTLADGTIVETGSTKITVANQDASDTAGFSINTTAYNNTVAFKAAQASNTHKTILYPGQGNSKSLSAYAYDANKDPLTEAVTSTNSEKVSYSVTSGDTLFQVNKDTGAVIYQAPKEGKATVQVKKGSFTYDALVELRNYAKLNSATTSKSALTVAELKTEDSVANNDFAVDASLQTDSLGLTLLDQYNTAFGSEFSNRKNGVAATFATGTNVTNDNGVVVGQSANISYTSGSAKTGKVVATADASKVSVTISDTGAITVVPKVRDISSDETVNLTIAMYDTTSNADGTLLQTITVPVTVKNITEATGQKVVKSNDMDASEAVEPKTSTVTLWEVDVDGDKVRKVKQSKQTVNRGSDLVSSADDVVLSSNEKIEFEAVVSNSEVDRFVKVDGPAYSATDVKADNKVLVATGGAVATATFGFNEPAANTVASLFGYDQAFTVKAKTSDSSSTSYLVAQTIDVRAYNSNTVAMAATIAPKTTVDFSKVNEILGQSANTPISIKNSVLGLYDKSEFIVDSVGGNLTTIAVKNGEDGAVIAPVVSLKDQSGNPLSIGPKAYGEEVTNTFASAKNAAVKGGAQELTFTATLLEHQNVALSNSPAIGAALTGNETVTLAADKEEGTVKVLLTGIYRNNDFPGGYSKNLLPASQIVTITYTK